MQNAPNSPPKRAKNQMNTSAAQVDVNRSKALFSQLGLSHAVAARALGISETSVRRILNENKWPRALHVRQDFVQWLAAQEKLAGLEPNSTPAVSPTMNETQEGEDTMLLQKQTLAQSTRKHFGLSRNPFFNEITCSDDIYSTKETRWIIESMLAQTKYGGMLALIGESGSGKTTLVQELRDRLKRDAGKSGNHGIVLIEPGVIFMEENDTKGKTLKAEDIGKTIIATIAPDQSPRRDRQARYRQMVDLLTNGHRAHQRYALLIEEAHCLPRPTLKHLKRFCEMKDGHAPLLSVILVGQTELRERLNVNEKEVREVAQRCDVYELPALNAELHSYIEHKFRRVGVDSKKIITPAAIEALREKLTLQNGAQNIAFPLVIGNMLIAAMNSAAEVGAPIVDVENIQGA